MIGYQYIFNNMFHKITLKIYLCYLRETATVCSHHLQYERPEASAICCQIVPGSR